MSVELKIRLDNTIVNKKLNTVSYPNASEKKHPRSYPQYVLPYLSWLQQYRATYISSLKCLLLRNSRKEQYIRAVMLGVIDGAGPQGGSMG